MTQNNTQPVVLELYAQKARLLLKGPQELLSSGMTGVIRIAFSFSEDWEGLQKTAVFSNGAVTMDVPEGEWENMVCTVPQQLLATAGKTLMAGVYGTDGEERILPTVWCALGRVEPGAVPAGVTAPPPEVSLWAQLQKQLGDVAAANPFVVKEISMLPRDESSITLGLDRSFGEVQAAAQAGRTVFLEVSGTVLPLTRLIAGSQAEFTGAVHTTQGSTYYHLCTLPETGDAVLQFLPVSGTVAEETIREALAQAKASGAFDGETGPKGDKGDKGDAGPAGENYILTAADRAEIAAMVGAEAVPDYVAAEAESVISRILAAQGENTFVIAALTDLHYGEGSDTGGVKHACQALKYLGGRLKLDAVAVLGDYTDGYPSTGIENALGDFKAVNSVLDGLCFSVNLRQQGNHDYYPDSLPITRRLIQEFSDGVIWGSRQGGYYHKDFADHKLRLICPNTNENNPVDTSTNKPSSSISMTDAQIRWFINTLDLSAKSDAEEWQILILSHQPMDYWVSDSKYRLSYILNAYQTGGSWTDGTISCNFAGKNKAMLICNIHGHIHNLLMDQMFLGNSNSAAKTRVYRMSTPNACLGRENQYTGAWGESVTYTKTPNSGKDTAFVVYCIDLSAHKITAVCYGAGYDRVLNYLEETVPEVYTVTNNLTHVTTSNAAASVTEGQSYTATLTPAGSTLQSVTVVMGGVDITATAYSHGQININAVTGDIVITAVGAAPAVYVNQIPVSIAADGSLYNGKGWKDNTRLNSSGAEAAADGMGVTGFIPVKAGDIVYMKGVKVSLTATGGKNEFAYLALFDAPFTNKRSVKFNAIGSDLSGHEYLYDSFTTDPATGYVTSFRIVDRYESMGSNGGYIRISADGLNGDAIITVNQPIG